MRKIYLELLVDENIADEILSRSYEEGVTLFKAEVLTIDNYDEIVRSRLKKEEA